MKIVEHTDAAEAHPRCCWRFQRLPRFDTDSNAVCRTLEGTVPRLEKEKAHAEGELMKAVNAMSEREAALSEVDA